MVFLGQERKNRIYELGYNLEYFKKLQEEINDKIFAFEMSWPNIFFSLETAREFYRNHCMHVKDLKCIGIGLHPDDLAELISNGKQCHYLDDGFYACIERKEFLDGNGRDMGYEILGYGGNTLHSYFCSVLGKELSQQGINFNEYGLIPHWEQAVKASYLMYEMELESSLYLPWLLREYSLK